MNPAGIRPASPKDGPAGPVAKSIPRYGIHIEIVYIKPEFHSAKIKRAATSIEEKL